jgi:hypothetical protein
MANFLHQRDSFPVDLNRTPARDLILEELKTYQWKPSATMMCFAIHIGYSETFVRLILHQLIADRLVERVTQGQFKGKPRYIWQLIKTND